MPLVVYLRLNIAHLGCNILATRLGISSPIGRNVIGTIEAFVPIVMWAAVEKRMPEVALVTIFVPAVALTVIMAPTMVFGTSLVLIAVVSAIFVVVLSVPSEGSSGHH